MKILFGFILFSMAELNLTEDQEKQIIIFIADDIMSNLNLNGIIEATKAFSLENAKRQYAELTDEDKTKVIEHMKTEDGKSSSSRR